MECYLKWEASCSPISFEVQRTDIWTDIWTDSIIWAAIEREKVQMKPSLVILPILFWKSQLCMKCQHFALWQFNDVCRMYMSIRNQVFAHFTVTLSWKLMLFRVSHGSLALYLWGSLFTYALRYLHIVNDISTIGYQLVHN